MDAKEKEELFKLEVEQLSLLEGREVKGGAQAGGDCKNGDCDVDAGNKCENVTCNK
ncbi:MAG: hypothetical protein PHC95_01370 [Parabacteroides sp.]|nr:hypothetical protein [Parabacteroides sp.]